MPNRYPYPAWVPQFIASLEEYGLVNIACRTVSVSQAVAYDHRARDPEFRAKWDEAIDLAYDKIEKVAIDRAKLKSDELLKFILQHRKPKVFNPPTDTKVSGSLSIAIDYSLAELKDEDGDTDTDDRDGEDRA